MSTSTAPIAYEDVTARYAPVIGLETHVELGTVTKMFCGCPTEFGAEPNTHVCPVCLGLPGSLPVANKAAIEATIRIGLALNCTIASWCRFARKNYFYPDMPKNFQISQYDEPLCTDGWLDVEVDGQTVRIGIERVHLEEDTGKTLHLGGATGRIHGATESLVDYNRAGIPLVEIVTKPVPGTGALAPTVAKAYVTELRDVIRSLGVSDVRMEQGSMRCDVNTSLSLPGAPWGTRTETKNVNSLRSVERAVRSEMIRQAGVLDAGRAGDPGDPALPRGDRRDYVRPQQGRGHRLPLLPGAGPGAAGAGRRRGSPALKAALPEAPRDRRRRLQDAWGLTDHDMQSVVNAGAVELIEATVAAGATPEAARKWWLGELSRHANASGVELADIGVTPAHVAELQKLVDDGKLTDKLARTVLDGVIAGEGTPSAGDGRQGHRGGLRHGRADHRHRRRDRGQRRGRSEGPGRQHGRRGRADRCGDEGDQERRRRQDRSRDDPG